MASGPEMMFKALFKALNVDADSVMKQVNGIGATITRMGNMMAAILSGIIMANRRLARIEAHLGLSDIEPIPSILVIDNAAPNEQPHGLGFPGLDDPAGAR